VVVIITCSNVSACFWHWCVLALNYQVL